MPWKSTEGNRSARTSGTWLAEGTSYVSTEFTAEGGADEVVERLHALDEARGTRGNRVYYLAVPPKAMEPTVRQIGRQRSASGFTRLIVEKPFGHDAASARELNALLTRDFDESEIFRIDHYLGKETVQNMLVLRFGNGIFEPIWNRNLVDHVQITVSESLGVEGRAGFYEQAGAIRDIVQNHVLQLVALTAMEPPIDFTAESVRNEKVKVLRAIHTPGPEARRPRPVRAGLRGGATRSPGTGRSPASPPTRRRRRSSPPSSTSTTGAGRTRRSTSGRASGSRAARRRSRSSSSARPILRSRSTRRTCCVRTCSSCTSSPTRASR